MPIVIYSPLPPELIWQSGGSEYLEIAEDTIEGIPVQLIISSDNTARIERIISSDPRDYLADSCQPGQIVNYHKATPPNKEIV